MKKVIFLFAMVLAVNMAMAQTNVADIVQYGSNIAVIEQTGDLNEGIITQGAVGSPVTNKGANLGGDWKYGSFITQKGTDNTAEVDVNTSSNGTSIDQLGNSNWAKQTLGASISKTTNWNRMGLDINQEGNNNIANQETRSSFGTHGVQGMMINQEGNFNIADQMSIGGAQQQVEIEQIGNNNNNSVKSGKLFDVSATGLTNPVALPWAHKPAGDFTQYMYENKGVTHMYVKGDDNNTYQFQEYDVWSISGQNDALMDVIGSRNNVAQGQLGDLNESEIDIEGNDNVVTTSQFGDSNIAKIELLAGSNNCVAGIEQIGNLNDADILQSGVNNFAKVIQQPLP